MYRTKQEDILTLNTVIQRYQQQLDQDDAAIKTNCSWTKGYLAWQIILATTSILIALGIVLNFHFITDFLMKKAGYINDYVYGFSVLKQIVTLVLLCSSAFHVLVSVVLFFRIKQNHHVLHMSSTLVSLKKQLNRLSLSLTTIADLLEKRINEAPQLTLAQMAAEETEFNGIFPKIEHLHQKVGELNEGQHSDITTASVKIIRIYRLGVMPAIAAFLILTLVILPHSSKTMNYQALHYSKPGDIIILGSYEQDREPSNGKEPIRWQVLKTETNKALLVSEMMLDKRPYHHSYSDITWENSTIRRWLNDEFFHAAFSDTEKNRIINGEIKNTDYIKLEHLYTENHLWHYQDYKEYKPVERSGTTDRVFLLSYEEAKLLPSFKTKATEYAKYQAPFFSSMDEWSLRSVIRYDSMEREERIGYFDRAFAAIKARTFIFFDHWYLNYNDTFVSVSDDTVGIRPAIWVHTYSASQNE